jgi:hypothetical protein
MNQDTVKEKLRAIHESPIDYVVIFSGKKSGKVNGLYKPFTKEIIIHNRNFMDNDGRQHENSLRFTAIHELAHHVMIAEKGNKSPRAHSQDFWATFHNLLDIAEKKGVYHAEIDAETQKLIDDAREIDWKIAELQRELGRVILAIEESCQKNGLKTEDIIERKVQIGKPSAKVAVAAFFMGDRGVGADIQAEAAKQRDGDKMALIIAAGHKGKSVVQAKKSGAPARPLDADHETIALIREKLRIEKTVESLARRLEEIKWRLIARGDDNGGES